MSIAFPDVCKTPSTWGPDTYSMPKHREVLGCSRYQSTVKADGEGIMLKGSNFRFEQRNKAGSAERGGVPS
jgi:hypothetical protein